MDPAQTLTTAVHRLRSAAITARSNPYAETTPYTDLMHPGVALAFADLLEHFAKTQFDPEAGIQVTDQSHVMALAAARQLLGEVAS